MHYKTLFFDYDGTIHDSIHIYYLAFLKAYHYLVEQGLQPERAWKREDMKVFLGQNPLEMWGSFRPKLESETINFVIKMVGEEMTKALENGEGRLFNGALETLSYLKDKGYTLVYLSNSKIYYMENQKRIFGLDRFFQDFVVSEQYGYIPKKDILKTILHKYEGPFVMIGDRIHDMESGHANNIDTIACHYGYGEEVEFKGATYHIQDIRALKDLL